MRQVNVLVFSFEYQFAVNNFQRDVGKLNLFC